MMGLNGRTVRRVLSWSVAGCLVLAAVVSYLLTWRQISAWPAIFGSAAVASVLIFGVIGWLPRPQVRRDRLR